MVTMPAVLCVFLPALYLISGKIAFSTPCHYITSTGRAPI